MVDEVQRGAMAQVGAEQASAADADGDTLILVDGADRDVGRLSKARCHDGAGILHRAFSLLIFNDAGDLLIQQRSAAKRLWPMYWSNSCCSHPRSGETMEAATRRRLQEELGIACDLEFLFKFQYQAQFDASGAENELCSVFIGRCADSVTIDPREILAWAWVSPEALQRQLTGPDGAKFTPWFTLEWARIWRDHRDAVMALKS